MHLVGDGLSLHPSEYAEILSRLAREGILRADHDTLGGSVERLEVTMAELLGKEKAVFFPTGTQANLAAISMLAPRGERVLASVHSHLFNVAGLYLNGGNPDAFRARLAERGIFLGEPLADQPGFRLQINETWARRAPERLAANLVEAAADRR